MRDPWVRPPRPLPPEQQISRNRLLTYVLGAVFVFHAGIFILLAGLLAGSWLAAALLAALFLSFVAAASLWFDRALLRSVNARRLAQGEHPRFEETVARLTSRLNIPRPALYVIDSDRSLNAFTCGRGPNRSAVIVTSGTLRSLSPAELEGVVAHELSHIRNGDMRVAMWSYALLGWVGLVSWLANRLIEAIDGLTSWLAGLAESTEGILGLVTWIVYFSYKGLIVSAGIAVFLWSFLAQLVELAISRRREYLADASAAQLTGNPLALASALEKAAHSPGLERGSALVGKVCIVRPQGSSRHWWEDLLSTHPSTEARIEALRRMAEATGR